MLLMLGCIAALEMIGCDREEQVVTYKVPKASPNPGQITGASSASAHRTKAETIKWTLPQGWRTQSGARPMRFATLEVTSHRSPDRGIEVSVTVLGGNGGGLLANLNRWREQLGLDPISEEELVNHVSRHETVNAQAFMADIVSVRNSKRHRMLAAIIFRSTAAWFFKIVGDDSVIAGHKPALVELIKSVRFVPTSSPTEATEAAAPPDVTWTVPPEWQANRKPGQFLLASFRAQRGRQSAQVTVSRFGGDVGGLLANINRWRGQMKLGPLTHPHQQSMERLPIGRNEGNLIELVGSQLPQKRMLVAMVSHTGFTWFFKMIGSSILIDEQRSVFKQFLQTVRFGGANGA